jgi:hypothetical protein
MKRAKRLTLNVATEDWKMKNCTKCKHAEWDRTKNGRLHPNGQGKCKYPYKLPELPASMFWGMGEMEPFGGWINRREQLLTHCPYYEEGVRRRVSALESTFIGKDIPV